MQQLLEKMLAAKKSSSDIFSFEEYAMQVTVLQADEDLKKLCRLSSNSPDLYFLVKNFILEKLSQKNRKFLQISLPAREFAAHLAALQLIGYFQ